MEKDAVGVVWLGTAKGLYQANLAAEAAPPDPLLEGSKVTHLESVNKGLLVALGEEEGRKGTPGLFLRANTSGGAELRPIIEEEEVLDLLAIKEDTWVITRENTYHLDAELLKSPLKNAEEVSLVAMADIGGNPWFLQGAALNSLINVFPYDAKEKRVELSVRVSPQLSIQSIAFVGGRPQVVAEGKLMYFDGQEWVDDRRSENLPSGEEIRVLVEDQDTLFIGTDRMAYQWTGSGYMPLSRLTKSAGLKVKRMKVVRGVLWSLTDIGAFSYHSELKTEVDLSSVPLGGNLELQWGLPLTVEDISLSGTEPIEDRLSTDQYRIGSREDRSAMAKAVQDDLLVPKPSFELCHQVGITELHIAVADDAGNFIGCSSRTVVFGAGLAMLAAYSTIFVYIAQLVVFFLCLARASRSASCTRFVVESRNFRTLWVYRWSLTFRPPQRHLLRFYAVELQKNLSSDSSVQLQEGLSEEVTRVLRELKVGKRLSASIPPGQSRVFLRKLILEVLVRYLGNPPSSFLPVIVVVGLESSDTLEEILNQIHERLAGLGAIEDRALTTDMFRTGGFLLCIDCSSVEASRRASVEDALQRLSDSFGNMNCIVEIRPSALTQHQTIEAPVVGEVNQPSTSESVPSKGDNVN